MKKTLLALSALMVAASGFAQTSQQSDRLAKATLPRLNVKYQGVRALDAAPQVRHTAATGLYYSTPVGAFYQGFGLDGRGYYWSKINVPMNATTTFTKVGTGSWKQGGRAVSATGDYTFTPDYGSPFFFAPALIQGADSFAIGTNNIYAKLIDQGNAQALSAVPSDMRPYVHWGFVGPDSTALLYIADDHGTFDYNNRTYTNGAAYGFLDTNYLFGSGSTTDNGTNYTAYQVEQYMGQTAAPLYVESIVTEGRTSVAAGPLTNGATLTAYVTGVTAEQGRNGVIYAADLDDVLDTLTAEAADTMDFKTVENESGVGTYYEGRLIFTKKVEDEFGTATNEPFIIPANKQFAIVIAGLDKAGVSYGIDGLRLNDDADANTQIGYIDVKTDDGTEYAPAFTFSSRLIAKIAINGMYDGVKAPAHPGLFQFEDESLNYNTVKISNDGKTNLTDGATTSVTEDGTGLPGAMVLTTIPFFDSEDNENYHVAGLPDWITGVNVQLLNEDAKAYILTFEASALPAGTSKRAATVYVTSDKGAVSDPIYLLQGDATVTDGINSASVENVKNSDNRIFNISGQQVNKSYKGIVIENGKKHIQ